MPEITFVLGCPQPCGTIYTVQHDARTAYRVLCPQCGGVLRAISRTGNTEAFQIQDRAAAASTRPTLRLPSREGVRLYRVQNEPSNNHTTDRRQNMTDIKLAVLHKVEGWIRNEIARLESQTVSF